jgi:hypothetical protein
VLENKSFNAVPHWLISALRRYGFRRGRYSKYSEAVLNTACGKEYFINAMHISDTLKTVSCPAVDPSKEK